MLYIVNTTNFLQIVTYRNSDKDKEVQESNIMPGSRVRVPGTAVMVNVPNGVHINSLQNDSQRAAANAKAAQTAQDNANLLALAKPNNPQKK